MFLVLCKALTVRTSSIYIEVGYLQATGLAPLNLLRKHFHGVGGVTESTPYLCNKATWLSIPYELNSHPPTQMQEKITKHIESWLNCKTV